MILFGSFYILWNTKVGGWWGFYVIFFLLNPECIYLFAPEPSSGACYKKDCVGDVGIMCAMVARD
jgi:hypothetical protein